MNERRLAAILTADVCGYSRLMGDDDEATVTTLDEYRRVFSDHVAAYSGRIIDTAGDSVLSEFSSVINAVEAGSRIQQDLEARNAKLPTVRRMCFRIGINVGDIIGKSDGTIYGDGVNIAARVESLAPPGGVGISGVVYEQVDDRLDHITFEYIGEHAVKNIKKPVNVYLVRRKAPEPRRVPGEVPRRHSMGQLRKGAASPEILIVDDSENNRYTLTRRLEKHGYSNLSTAENGRTALEFLDQSPCDLVLLDIMMPEINGYEVLEQIKADCRLRDIPVIVISAVQEMDSVVRCLELGADDYLPKPFNASVLKARVGACLERKRLRDEQGNHVEELRREKKRAERVLRSLLPDGVVRKLKTGTAPSPQRHTDVAVLSCSIQDFAHRCSEGSPEQILSELRPLVESFEQTLAAHDMPYVAGAGSWLAAAGLGDSNDAVLRAVLCALGMIETARCFHPRWLIQFGIDYGTACAGIVGRQRYSFDLWGNAVDVARAAMSQAQPNTVTVTGAGWQHIASDFRGRSRGGIEVADFGAIELVECTGTVENHHN